MLYTQNCGMPVLDHLLLFLVKESGLITFQKATWNRCDCLSVYANKYANLWLFVNFIAIIGIKFVAVGNLSVLSLFMFPFA